MTEPSDMHRRLIADVTAALTRVQTNDQRRRDSFVQLRREYAQLEPLKPRMSKEDLQRFEEIGELIRALEQFD
jgi:hypothetical protein